MVSKIKDLLHYIPYKPLRWLVVIAFCMTFLLTIFVVAIFTYTYSLGPPPLTSDQTTVYYSESGEVIGEESNVENRYWMRLEDMDPKLIDATLHTEDRRFYEHHGFDVKRIIGALIEDIKSMSMAEGASTITQQYARNLYLSHEKSWTRKIKEALYTVRLELFYEKDEILEGYLNTIYYGHGAYGVEAASRQFFHKSASDLSLAEAALLAGVPKGPSYYSPLHHYENAKKRQEQILASLADAEMISEQEYITAKNEQLDFSDQPEHTNQSIAPYFQDVVLQELQRIVGLDLEQVRSGGYHVYTTLDIENQQALKETVDQKIRKESDIQAAVVAMDPDTGAITSMIGGRDYNQSQFNRATQAKRMAGSTFKPFLYYAALENGFTPVTPFISKPTNFELADGTVYQPSNYNGYYAEKPITLAQAMALSDNIYAVKTNLYLTPKKLVETAKRFGITSDLPAVASLALGTGSVSVKEMVAGYSMIANGGKKVMPHTIEKVTDSFGNVIYERPQQQAEVELDPKKAFILTHVMTGMFDESLNGYMRVTGASIADELTQHYAGKSGTTKTDSWMIGYSPNLVTGVWTGYDENTPINKTKELQYAKDIWAAFMEKAHADQPLEPFYIPDGVVGAYIDPASGKIATPYCDQHRLMYFEEGDVPNSYCSLHKLEDEPSEQKENKPEKEQKEEKKSGWKKLLEWVPFIGD